MPLLVAGFLSGDLDRDEFASGCEYVCARGWLPSTVVINTVQQDECIDRVRRRAGPGDLHVTGACLPAAFAAHIVVRDALRWGGDVTVIEACACRMARTDADRDGSEAVHDLDRMLQGHIHTVLRPLAVAPTVPRAATPVIEHASFVMRTDQGANGVPPCGPAAGGAMPSADQKDLRRGAYGHRDQIHVAAANIDEAARLAVQAGSLTLRADREFLCATCPTTDEVHSASPAAAEPRATHPDDVIPGDVHHGGDPLAQDYYERDGCVSGVKAQLKGRLARTPDLALHYKKAHKPWRGDCAVCLGEMGVFKVNGAKSVDPHHDERPACCFAGDMITFSVRSRQGYKYLWLMRCGAGFLCGFPLRQRSDLTSEFKRWLTKMRRDSRYGHLGYSFCLFLMIDLAGEQCAAAGHWMEDNSDFNSMLREFDPAPIVVRRFDPTQKSSAGPAENIMRSVEITLKSILRQGCMPAEFWVDSYLSKASPALAE
jgi:hypothetical protein